VRITESFAHGDKLRALRVNPKLPQGDQAKVDLTIERYNAWKAALDAVEGTATEILHAYVSLLNEYKRFVELDLIFDSDSDFLYRQKGQLKLDNTILEEFLPRLFDERLVPGFGRIQNILCGPRASFAGLSFDSPLMALSAGGANVKLKDQDFSVTKLHKITITESPAGQDVFSADVAVSYFATEIKTNLDKTMFQEAAQTAGELKRAVSGSKYVLLCEYLDMKPINTKLTPIDEVIVLRKAKRLASNVRENFSTSVGRRNSRARYVEHLDASILKVECFARFIEHLNECFPTERADQEDVVLGRGYF
jgi:hypothetical protein